MKLKSMAFPQVMQMIKQIKEEEWLQIFDKMEGANDAFRGAVERWIEDGKRERT